MKRDIETREDIELLLKAFYSQATIDSSIKHFFTEVIQLDIEKHIPIIADFWEAVLFGTHGYRKNVMEVHHHIHNLSVIQKSIWIDGCSCLLKP